MFLDSLMHVEICSFLGNHGAYMEDTHIHIYTYIYMYVYMYVCIICIHAVT